MFILGITSGILGWTIWTFFWISFGRKHHNLKKLKHWIESSYRRSILLIISVTIGYFSLYAKLLDVINALLATTILLSMVTISEIVVVSKNKLWRIK